MSRFATRLLTLAIFAVTLLAMPVLSAYAAGGTGLSTDFQREKLIMKKFAIRLLTLAVLSLTLAAAPVVTAVYAAPDNDPPPQPPQGKKKRSSEVRPGGQETAFANGYRAAFVTIYDRHDYAGAIAAEGARS